MAVMADLDGLVLPERCLATSFIRLAFGTYTGYAALPGPCIVSYVGLKLHRKWRRMARMKREASTRPGSFGFLNRKVCQSDHRHPCPTHPDFSKAYSFLFTWVIPKVNLTINCALVNTL